jgi:hypothetical protein
LASQGKFLPTYITKEFEEYLKCGRLKHGFLRVRCDTCHDEKLVAFNPLGFNSPQLAANIWESNGLAPIPRQLAAG